MAQRITAVMAAIGAAACVAACLVLWQFVQDSRASQAAALAEMRDFNAKLLAGMQAPPPGPPAASRDWSRVRIRLVAADGGQPVTDATVKLEGRAFSGDADGTIRLHGTPANGLVDLGSAPFGRYGIEVQCPGRQVRLSEAIVVGPDFPEELVLRVPDGAGEGPGEIALAPPDDINESLKFVIHFHLPPVVVDGHEWTREAQNQAVILDRSGNLEHITNGAYASGKYQGRQLNVFGISAGDSLPSLPLSIAHIDIVQPTEVPIETPNLNLAAYGLNPLSAFDLHSWQPAEMIKVEDADGSYRIELPEAFWTQLAQAEVRAGLRPLPAGRQIVEIPIYADSRQDWAHPGRRVDVILSYVRRDAHDLRASVELLNGIDILSIDEDPATLRPDGRAAMMVLKSIVPDPAAELVAAGKQLKSPTFQLRLSKDGFFAAEPTNNDTALLERLKLEATVPVPPTETQPL